jgi:hypothetical protein
MDYKQKISRNQLQLIHKKEIENLFANNLFIGGFLISAHNVILDEKEFYDWNEYIYSLENFNK